MHRCSKRPPSAKRAGATDGSEMVAKTACNYLQPADCVHYTATKSCPPRSILISQNGAIFRRRLHVLQASSRRHSAVDAFHGSGRCFGPDGQMVAQGVDGSA